MLEELKQKEPCLYERIEALVKKHRIEDADFFCRVLVTLGVDAAENDLEAMLQGTSYELPPRLQQGDRVKVVKDYEDPEGPWINVTGTLKLKLDRPTPQNKTWIVTMDEVPEDCGDPRENEAWWHESELERIMEE